MQISTRIQAFLWHLATSAVIALVVLILIRWYWFPSVYWNMAKGQTLFLIIVAVDVLIGPTITLLVFNTRKTKHHLLFDVCVVATLQLSALAYGVYSICLARPVFNVFVIDRFNVVNAIDLTTEDLLKAEHESYKHMPWTGPVLVSARRAKDGQEVLQIVEDAIKGKDVQFKPKYYQPYENACPAIQAALKPLDQLAELNPNESLTPLTEFTNRVGSASEYGFLPVDARGSWTALLNKNNCQVAAFLPLNGF